MNCLFCNKFIPPNRLYKWTKYCSNDCNKDAYRLRKNPKIASLRAGNPKFWKTETGIGFRWEKYIAKLLDAKHRRFLHGADLIWKGKLIDVKACELYRRKFKRGKPVIDKQSGVWVFNRNKDKPIDFFACVALLKGKPQKVFLIPSKDFPISGVSIGQNSKYDKFIYVRL